MQLLARLMDHALAARGERRTIVVATSGDTGGAAVEAFRDRNQVDLIVLFPNGRVSDVQRRMMTTVERRQCPRARRRRHLRRLPGDREGHVQPCTPFATACASPASIRSTGRGSWRRRSITSPPRCRSARRTAGSRSRCRPGISATSMPAMWRSAWACRSTGWSIATNVNDILARTLATGTYEPRAVVPTTSPSMDIQVSSNFERLLFDAYNRDAGAVRGLMGSLDAVAAVSRCRRTRCRRSAPLFSRRPRRRGRGHRPPCATVRRETGNFIDPHTAVGIAVAEKEPRDPALPMVVLSTAHPAKFPDAVEAATGARPALPEWLSDLNQRPQRMTALPADQSAVEQFVLSTSRAAQEGAAA